MDEKNENVNEEPSRREARHARMEERRQARGGGAPWLVGLILIAVGAVVLLQNTTGFYLMNWWALFILIPAFGAFSNAWRAYQDDGTLNRRATSALIGGIVLTAITVIFLLNLNWVIFGPVMLILGGVALLLNSLVK